MYHKKIHDNNGVHIHHIVNTTTCTKHSADEGAPCWSVYHQSTQTHTPAVCGSRIKKAGFTGKIGPDSLRRSTGTPRSKSPAK